MNMPISGAADGKSNTQRVRVAKGKKIFSLVET